MMASPPGTDHFLTRDYLLTIAAVSGASRFGRRRSCRASLGTDVRQILRDNLFTEPLEARGETRILGAALLQKYGRILSSRTLA